MTRLADLAAYLYVGFLTLAVSANIGQFAVAAWALVAARVAYRKAGR